MAGFRQAAACGAATVLAILFAAPAGALAQTPSAPAAKMRFDIPGGPAAAALNALASQAGVQILYPFEAVQGRQTPALRGEYTRSEAIARLAAAAGLRVASSDGSVTRLEPLGAVQSESFGLEEVVVTALRREVRLQDTPVAVSAFGADQLEARDINSLDQIDGFAPNIRFDGAAALSGGNYNATVFIRGVGQNDFAVFSDPGVGIYVDGVYYARSIGGTLDAFDVQQIEVLRGPQGTLFGKNTIGGAVLVTSQQPKEEFGGEVEVATGSFNRADLKAHVDAPLADNVFTRLSFATLNRDGYAKRIIDGEDMGDRNAMAGRVQLRWEASEDLTVNFNADYTRAREHSAPNTLIAVAPAAGFSGQPFLANFNTYVAPGLGITAPNGQRALNSSWITGDPYRTYATGPNVNDLDLWGAALTLDWRLGPVNVKSITAYRNLEATFARDGDNSPFTYRETYNHDTQDQLSQEIQFSGKGFGDRLNWVAGLYAFRENALDVGYARLAMGLVAPNPPPYSPAATVYTDVQNTTYAAFAQGALQLTDRLSLTLGGRYNYDEKEYYLDHRRIRDNVAVANLTVSDSWDSFTPKVGVEFKPTREILLYVSYAEGFKSGGFNARPLDNVSEVTAYQPEVLKTYEVGAKTAWFDGRLILNAAAYWSTYEDIQLTVNQTPRNFVANAAAGEIQGYEIELFARPADGIDVNLAVGHTETEYTAIGQGLGPTQILPITLTSKFAKSPEWTVAAGIQYTVDLEGRGSVRFRTDWTYNSLIYNDIANDPDLAQKAYALLGARLSWTSPSEAWEVALSGSNINDARYKSSANASSAAFGLKEASYGPPAQWALSLARKF